MDTTRRTQWLERLDALRADAAEALTAASGGRSLCRVGREYGGGGPANLKHHEGRMAVFSELRRALMGASGDDVFRQALAETRARWEALRAKHADRPSGAWFAYASGGLEALDEVAADLGA